MLLLRLASCTSALMLVAAAAPNKPSSDLSPIGACMNSAAQQLGFHGVAYAQHGDLVVERSFGMSDAAGKVPITPATRFDIGSAGKMFTALAIAILVDRGEIDLDAPIDRYLSDVPPTIGRITAAQLLNHTSGLGNYFKPENLSAIKSAASVAQLLPLALADPPSFAPGSKRAYSNSGFVVLGALIERASGVSYKTFIEQQILQPLGMSHTSFEATDSAAPMTRMSPAGPLAHAVVSPLARLPASPAGGIYSTAEDMGRLLSAIEHGRLVSQATWRRFLAPRPDPSGQPALYGYGFNVQTQPYRRIGHGGGAPGVNAQIALYPASKWQLIALSNGDPPAASQMVDVLQHAVHDADPGKACRSALKALPASSSPDHGTRPR